MTVKIKSVSITETMGALFFCLLFNYLGWKDSPGFYGFEPSPYLIIIVLIASRYGIFGGLFSSVVCCASLSILAFVFLGKTVFNDAYLTKNAILFFVSGWVIGEIRQGYIKKTSVILSDFDREKARCAKLNDENNLIRKVNTEMERRILDDVSTFASLYETSKHLQSFELETIYKAVLNILVQYLDASECAVYLVKGDFLVLKEKLNPDQNSSDEINLLFDEGIIAKSARDKRPYSVKDALDGKRQGEILDSNAIMSAPLIKTNGELIGALAIQKMPFFKITGSSVKIFSLLADWVSADIENAMYFNDVKKKNIMDDVLNIYTYDYFQHRLDQEFYRAKRYMMPISVVLIKVKKLEEIHAKKAMNMLVFVAGCLSNSLRLLDIVTRYKEDIHFSVILTSTNKDQAKLAMNRIMDVFNAMGVKTINDGKPLEIEYSISSIDSATETKEQLLAEAESALLECLKNISV